MKSKKQSATNGSTAVILITQEKVQVIYGRLMTYTIYLN